MSKVLTNTYCNHIQHILLNGAVIPKVIIVICQQYVGKKLTVICCNVCKKYLKKKEFGKSQIKKKNPRCKECVINGWRMKKKKKCNNNYNETETKKPFKISINKCKDAIINSLELNDCVGIMIANIILSYSHIIIEGIYRFGHKNDNNYYHKQQESYYNDDYNYSMHKLILEPNKEFIWIYDGYLSSKSKYSSPKSATFNVKGKYEIILQNKQKIVGKTKLKLTGFNDNYYDTNSGPLIAEIECDKNLNMSFNINNNDDNYPQNKHHYIFNKIIYQTSSIKLGKLAHSAFIIPS